MRILTQANVHYEHYMAHVEDFIESPTKPFTRDDSGESLSKSCDATGKNPTGTGEVARPTEVGKPV